MQGVPERDEPHPLRPRDVRHHEPSGRGHRDPEVDILMDEDLRGCVTDRFRPAGIDHWMPLDRGQQRLCDKQQRGHLHTRELGQGGNPVPSRHHLGDIDADELGYLRRGVRAGHHRRRGRAPDAGHRYPADAAGRLLTGRQPGRLDVRPADRSVRPSTGDPPQVDAEIPSQLADRWFRQYPRLGSPLGVLGVVWADCRSVRFVAFLLSVLSVLVGPLPGPGV